MLHVHDADVLGYRPAWDLQLALHERVMSGELAAGALLLVEHPPVVTLGRRAAAGEHLRVSREVLAERGVELVESDRGGDITFHGPGQLVAYPIVPLNYYRLNLHQYMRLLEEVVIRALGRWDLEGHRLEGKTGVWIRRAGEWSKICAMGVKVRRWVTLHGLALNVTTDLSCFELINPCGLGMPVTSMKELLGAKTPAMAGVKNAIVAEFQLQLQSQLQSQ